ncbi:cytochrome b/b6 domain-containing protein [Corynebacterium aquatimens]|uniref:cytochrome b/b6 domain-containing protein n=1 Tax=Corynebacterium aquatimens TaxID=1190508 RepID=UPI0025402BDF|nr:cytochrome b/b6 domain-containing protein [Corynebacterium aquatimens]
MAGGPAWPEAATAQIPAVMAVVDSVAPTTSVAAEPAEELAEEPAAPAEELAAEPVVETVAEPATPEQPAAASAAEPATPAQEPARPSKPDAPRSAAPTNSAGRKVAGARDGSVVKQKWLLVALALLVLGVIAVFGARWLVGTPWGADFVAEYPGTQPLPEGALVGLPAWLNWAHFFNMFLMVLVIRTGLQVRNERKPEAYWAPRRTPKRKISLTLWLHQALDVLWVLNGLVFYILLFATGHWVRIVPTSWDVFPNALSAGLQYLTLNWPLENGWVHYNALQELAYFTTVFIAAPLAIISGFRMSTFWSDTWKGASKAYPLPRRARFTSR